MKFQVPQFIEVEDKIFGPLTLKQFLYLAGGGAAIFLIYVSLPFFLFVVIALPIGAFAAALAFYKVNNQPFIKVVENALRHSMSTKIYTWQKTERKIDIQTQELSKEKQRAEQETTLPKLNKRKLSDLAWSLDIKKEK